MGEADTPLGAAKATVAAGVGTAERSAGRTDPLSRPFVLPSRGIYHTGQYSAQACTDGIITIAPTRGAQEEILAGARDNPKAVLPALRHVSEQCIDTKGLPFNDLLLFDWMSAMLHWLALSAGSDEIGLAPVHDQCGRSSNQTRPLAQLPCKVLRVADPGEDPTFTPGVLEDEDIAFLREMEAEERDEGGGDYEVVLSREDAEEPFTTKPLPHTGQTITWRHHRLKDMVRAEQFAERAGDRQTTPGSKMHNFLLASQIVGIDGRQVGPVEAVTWVKGQPTPILNALREDIAAREFGYDINPRFRCPHCGGTFRVRLPLDGSLFRRRRGS